MRILIVNQPLNNRGDESAHKALNRSIIRALPNAHVQVLFVGSNEDSIRQFTVHSNVQYTNLKKGKFYSTFMKNGLYTGLFSIWNMHPTIRKVMKIIQHSDVVLCAPGGICMGGFYNWQHLAYLYIAKRMNKKIVYYGRSFGPFSDETKRKRRFKEISYELLHTFDFLAIRDQMTERLADEIGVRYFSTVDAAFLDEPQIQIPNEVHSMIGTGEYMVLTPNVLVWHYSYKNIPQSVIHNFFESIIKFMLKEYPTLTIVMLPQTFNYKKEIDNDYNFLCELKMSIGSDRIVVIPDTYSSDIQQSIISKSKFIIGSRYHSIIFAINMNRPFVALIYEHKISGLLEKLDKRDCMVEISDIFNSEQKINKALLQISQLLPVISDDAQMKEKARKISNDCFDQFISWVKAM